MKRRKKHKASILQDKDGRCYLCMLLNDDYTIKSNLHEHHIFGGPNRIHSEAAGLKVYLCVQHHIVGQAAVHNNATNMRILQEAGQKAYEKNHTRQQFIETFGKNYLRHEEKKNMSTEENGFIRLSESEGDRTWNY